MTERRLLDATRLLGVLPEEVRDALRDHVVIREFQRGDVLVQQGAESNELFVVLEGRIAVVTMSNDGRQSVIAVLESGGLFGELGLFDGAPRSADVRALTETRVAVLPYEPMRAVLENRPELLWVLLRLLAQRLRATDEALADAVFLDVPARTAKRLLELAGTQDQFAMPLTQEELAALVGASRERVNKALALFTRLGWLEAEGRNQYRIRDRQALEDRATW
jgi:CRP-like cAMP-binding protein